MTLDSPLFLFAFLPVVVVLYSFLNPRWRNILVFIASLGFYLFGDPSATIMLLVLVIVNWGLGTGIKQLRANHHQSSWLAGLAIAINLAALAYFKYAAFAIGSLNALFKITTLHLLPVPTVVPPLGISFITFTAISYIVDILRVDAEAYRNPFHTFVFLALFPKVIAGPITTFKSLAGLVFAREWGYRTASNGGARFILGLAKKIIIADTIGITVNRIFDLPADQLTPLVAWAGAIGFTLQLYFDFSGYSDMAIGLGGILGFRFIENFNYPYVSTSIRDFWSRWHISLTNWFREYLYIPLGGNRAGRLRTYGNLAIVFLVCGLWHGAKWTFVVWGAWHGLFMIIERIPWVLKLGKAVVQSAGNKCLHIFYPIKYCYAMLVVVIGWVIFRSSTLPQGLRYIQTMFGHGDASAMAPLGWYMPNSVIIAIVAGCIFSFPISGHLLTTAKKVTAVIAARTTPTFSDTIAVTFCFIVLVLLLLLSVMMITTRGFQPFIYAQF